MVQNLIEKTFIYLRSILLVILVAGIILNFLLKDFIWPLSGIYYLFPIRVLLFISIIYFFFAFKNKMHLIASVVFFILFFLITLTADSGFIENDLPPKLILWNVARDKTTSEDLTDFITQQKADVYIFIEFDKKKGSEAEKLDLNKLLSSYNLYRLRGNTAISVKKNFEVTRVDSLDDSNNYFNIVESNGIIYAVVDIGSWPFYNRAKPFNMLNQLLTKYDVDIIAGDFNTPFNSIHFEELFHNYNCGDTEMKYGRETWPSFFPLVSLDHILVSKTFKIISYKPEKNCLSDHYPILLNYEGK